MKKNDRLRKKKDALIYQCLHRYEYRDGVLYWSQWEGNRRKGLLVSQHTRQDCYNGVTLVGSQQAKTHRVIWAMFNKTLPPVVDHINRNHLDNRIENLRASTDLLNRFNCDKRSNNSTGHIGVRHKPPQGGKPRWCAVISVNKKRIYLGYFSDYEKACKASKEAKLKYHNVDIP